MLHFRLATYVMRWASGNGRTEANYAPRRSHMTYYLLPTTYYLLPTTYYLLPTTYYLLSLLLINTSHLLPSEPLLGANGVYTAN